MLLKPLMPMMLSRNPDRMSGILWKSDEDEDEEMLNRIFEINYKKETLER